jgi:hypothetical protein
VLGVCGKQTQASEDVLLSRGPGKLTHQPGACHRGDNSRFNGTVPWGLENLPTAVPPQHDACSSRPAHLQHGIRVCLQHVFDLLGPRDDGALQDVDLVLVPEGLLLLRLTAGQGQHRLPLALCDADMDCTTSMRCNITASGVT